jgi:hypothetical protein
MSRSAATGFDVLRHRVAQLDRCVPGEIYAPLDEYRDPDAVWFARVLGRRTDMSGTVDENGRPAWSQIEPDEADAIVAGCGLIERMRAAVPHVVDGPVDLTAQLWVHDQSAHGPAGSEVPSEEFFVPVDTGTIRDAATKPWDVGFFTPPRPGRGGACGASTRKLVPASTRDRCLVGGCVSSPGRR